MGRCCSVSAVLDAKLDSAVIQSVLTHGLRLGFQYYMYSGVPTSRIKHTLSIPEAVDHVIKELNTSRHDIFGQRGNVDFNFQNNAPFLIFLPPHATTSRVTLSTPGIPWFKQDTDDTIIDFDLYITLLLELCKDFAILEISTDDEYFNYP